MSSRRIKSTKAGSIEKVTLDIDYSLDKNFKPGLYIQTKSF